METIDDLTVNYEADGVLKVKEVDKAVLSKGAWATVMYSYQDWDERKSEYGPLKATIRRYKKIQGSYRQQSKFNISSGKQARAMMDVLNGWFPPES